MKTYFSVTSLASDSRRVLSMLVVLRNKGGGLLRIMSASPKGSSRLAAVFLSVEVTEGRLRRNIVDESDVLVSLVCIDSSAFLCSCSTSYGTRSLVPQGTLRSHPCFLGMMVGCFFHSATLVRQNSPTSGTWVD